MIKQLILNCFLINKGGRGQIKQKKKTVPQKVTIAKIPRAKKKYVTRVCGLATFEIDLKEAQRFFAQKFSCGASVTGAPQESAALYTTSSSGLYQIL